MTCNSVSLPCSCITNGVLVTLLSENKLKRPDLSVFADIHVINTPGIADFMLSTVERLTLKVPDCLIHCYIVLVIHFCEAPPSSSAYYSTSITSALTYPKIPSPSPSGLANFNTNFKP